MKRKTKRELEQAVVRAAVRWFVVDQDDERFDGFALSRACGALRYRVRDYLRATKKPRGKR